MVRSFGMKALNPIAAFYDVSERAVRFPATGQANNLWRGKAYAEDVSALRFPQGDLQFTRSSAMPGVALSGVGDWREPRAGIAGDALPGTAVISAPSYAAAVARAAGAGTLAGRRTRGLGVIGVDDAIVGGLITVLAPVAARGVGAFTDWLFSSDATKTAAQRQAAEQIRAQDAAAQAQLIQILVLRAQQEREEEEAAEAKKKQYLLIFGGLGLAAAAVFIFAKK